MREDKPTYCRICEPLCGMIATVEDNRLIALRPDKEHPLSKGFACPKGIAFTEIVNDPDRVRYPLRRRADGGFDEVTWDTALADITERLQGVARRHGTSSIGWYFGNPATFSTGHTLWTGVFMSLLGTQHVYSAGSQDVNNRFVASHFLYGNPVAAPIPDINRVEYLLMIGANPIVSHGSVMSSPRIRDGLRAITKRGGTVTVVDPRRTETAREFDWLPITPDTDALFLLSLLHVMFDDGLADVERLSRRTRGLDRWRSVVEQYPPEATATPASRPSGSVRSRTRSRKPSGPRCTAASVPPSGGPAPSPPRCWIWSTWWRAISTSSADRCSAISAFRGNGWEWLRCNVCRGSPTDGGAAASATCRRCSAPPRRR